ncbi:hypothetical protein M3Y99_01376800 [Aphelenchoides fujianensis]|nr:hypothetical protein M3Y99_01376800 [Aphelenchoides fujianensis]
MDQIWHILLSVALHVFGISTGLWIWYLFPKNPMKHVTRVAVEKRGGRERSASRMPFLAPERKNG